MQTRASEEKHIVIVALRDKQSLVSLLDLACRMAKTMNASMLAVHVVEVPVTLDLSAQSDELDSAGKAVLKEAQRIAHKSFGVISTDRLTLLYIIATAVGTTDFVTSSFFGSQYLGKLPVTMFA